MKQLQDDGTYREVDPATWGTVTPLQQAKRLADTDEWPAMGVEPVKSRGWTIAATWFAVLSTVAFWFVVLAYIARRVSR